MRIESVLNTKMTVALVIPMEEPVFGLHFDSHTATETRKDRNVKKVAMGYKMRTLLWLFCQAV